MAVGGLALAICGASTLGTHGTGPTTPWPPQPTASSCASISAICNIKENIKVIIWGGEIARGTRNTSHFGRGFWEGVSSILVKQVKLNTQ